MLPYFILKYQQFSSLDFHHFFLDSIFLTRKFGESIFFCDHYFSSPFGVLGSILQLRDAVIQLFPLSVGSIGQRVCVESIEVRIQQVVVHECIKIYLFVLEGCQTLVANSLIRNFLSRLTICNTSVRNFWPLNNRLNNLIDFYNSAGSISITLYSPSIRKLIAEN